MKRGPQPTPITEDNRWGLTPREDSAMRAVITTGSLKGALEELQISMPHLSRVLTQARRKIGGRTRLQALLLYDRETRDRKLAGI